MSGSWGLSPAEINCPYCKAPEQDMEDLGDSPDYLSGTCAECGKSFSISIMREEFYNEKGDIIR